MEVERRLVDTLLSMANEQGEIILKMSRKDLASHLGMSRDFKSQTIRLSRPWIYPANWT